MNYFVTYTLGVMVGQDIWQRFFTGKTKRISKASGVLVGLYSALYSIVMVIVGMCAYVLFPNIQNTQNVFAHMAFEILPNGLLGIVFAALIAAIMSTASGTLLASATIISNDLLKPYVLKIWKIINFRADTFDYMHSRSHCNSHFDLGEKFSLR